MIDTTHSVEHGDVVGVQANYNFTFKTLVDGSEVKLSVLQIPGAAEVPLANPADFTVVVNSTGIGGVLTFITPLNYDTWRYTIYRETDEKQEVGLENSGQAAYPLTELGLDQGVRWNQEQEEELARSLTLPITDETNDPATMVTALLGLIAAGTGATATRETLLWDSDVDDDWSLDVSVANVDIGFFHATLGDPRLALYQRLRIEINGLAVDSGALGDTLLAQFLDEFGGVATAAEYQVNLTRRHFSTPGSDERIAVSDASNAALFSAIIYAGSDLFMSGPVSGEFDLYLPGDPFYHRAAYRLHSVNWIGGTPNLTASEGHFAFTADMPTAANAIACGLRLTSAAPNLNLSDARARVWGIT